MAEPPDDVGHHRPEPRPPGRRPLVHRQGLLVAALLLATVSAASAASTGRAGAGSLREVAAADAVAGTGQPPGTVPPAGAGTLPAAPVLVDVPEPADPGAITGLAANGIPTVALDAYRVAAGRMATTQPSCGIDWSLLAGIGRVESNHGRFGGASLNPDGTSSPPIVGPALDGVQFAFIPDSDGGRWDGDARYDRAVGPMQFIPGTWWSYGIDADGNGSEDPLDIDDAALAAGHYLCVAGGDLTTDAGKRRAVLAYNHSDSYVDQVLALAAAYAAGIPVADLPLSGDTTSPVPAPFGDPRAPAAPGPAMGAGDFTPSKPGQATVLPGTASAPAADPGSGTAPPADQRAAAPPTDQQAAPPTAGSSGSGSGGGSGTSGGTRTGGNPAQPPAGPGPSGPVLPVPAAPVLPVPEIPAPQLPAPPPVPPSVPLPVPVPPQAPLPVQCEPALPNLPVGCPPT